MKSIIGNKEIYEKLKEYNFCELMEELIQLYRLQKDCVVYVGSCPNDDLELEEMFPHLTEFKNILLNIGKKASI